MWPKAITTLSTATAVLAISVLAGTSTALEQADYKVIKEDGKFEVREFKPRVVAETYVEADFEEAGNKAFKALFGYISGENKGSKKIEMTAPVNQETSDTSTVGEGQRIDMTAPVNQQTSGSKYRVTFILPASYTIENAPEPTNEEVKLQAEPAHQAAVYTYNGQWEKELYEQKLGELKQWMTSSSLTAKGDPIWARYNSPMSLPVLRRNEVLIPIEDVKGTAGKED